MLVSVRTPPPENYALTFEKARSQCRSRAGNQRKTPSGDRRLQLGDHIPLEQLARRRVRLRSPDGKAPELVGERVCRHIQGERTG